MNPRLVLLAFCFASSLHAQEMPRSSTPVTVPSGNNSGSLNYPSTPASWTLSSEPTRVEQVANLPRVWGSVEAFLAYVKKPSVPPLISSIPAVDADSIDSTGGPTLYPNGGSRINYGSFSGLRASIGGYFDESGRMGAEVTGFVVDQREQESRFGNAAPNPRFLTRFFVDSNTGDNIFLFANNNLGPAFARGTSKIEPIYSGEINFLVDGYTILADKTDVLIGFRYFEMRENLQVDFRQDFTQTGVPGSVVSFTDRFAAENRFYGANFGVRSHFFATRRLGGTAGFKIALGNMAQKSSLSSNTLVNVPGLPFFNGPDGLYVRPTNAGERTRDFFALIPEVNLRLNYAVTPRAKVFVGYDAVFVSSVVRPGTLVDGTVFSGNLRLLSRGNDGPNTNRPQVQFEGTDLFIHAISLGMSLEF
jgi:hypothetical protein